MNYYLEVLKKYAVFSGRARRKEFWLYTLFYFIFIVIAVAIDNLLGLNFGGMEYGYGPVTGILLLLHLIPSIAVTVRRLHDIGKSGWWILISLVPLIGGIWLLVLEVTDSEAGENEYGPNPKLRPSAA